MRKVQASVGQAWLKVQRASRRFNPRDGYDSDDNIYDAPRSSKRRKIAADVDTEDLVTEATQALANLRTSTSSSGSSKIEVQVNTRYITTFYEPRNEPRDILDQATDVPLPESDDEGDASSTETRVPSQVQRPDWMDPKNQWLAPASIPRNIGPTPPPHRPKNFGLGRTPNRDSPEPRLEDHPRFIATDCGLCGQFVGSRRYTYKGSLEAEKKVYLPCGHWYGHECLYTWLSGVKGRMGRLTCPESNCILLRYECEHAAEPSLDPPRLTSNGDSSRPIPWDCDFCVSESGKKLREIAKNAKAKVDKVSATHDIRSKSVLLFHERYLKFAEDNLDKQQRAWAVRN